MMNTALDYIKRVLGVKLVILTLCVVIAVLLFVLWLVVRQRELLPALAGAPLTVACQQSQQLDQLTFPQLIEGLTRFEHDPAVLFTRPQAERLVPVMPLLRQVLSEENPQGGTASYLAPRARLYVERTLNAAQVEYVLKLAAHGQLSSKNEVVVDRLPGLDKALHQRIGLYDDLSNSSNSPVRKSLNKVNLVNLMLGMLMLEQVPEQKITAEQAKVMVSLLPILKKMCVRNLAKVRSAYEPVVEAQIRSLLTDAQKLKVLELVQANVVGKLDVNEESLFKKVQEFVVARAEGDDIVVYSNFLLAPVDKSLEGPAVIRGRDYLELAVLMRGILYQLEKNPKLRLNEEQISALELIAPAIQQVLNNVLKGVKDMRMPELQGRVTSILNNDQLKYIAEHKLDSKVRFNPSKDNIDPLSKELERFFTWRHLNIAFTPMDSGQNSSKVLAKEVAKRQQEVAPRQQEVAPNEPAANSTANNEKLRIKVMPFDALVRGILVTLERQPSLSVNRGQLAYIAQHYSEYRRALNVLEKDPDASSPAINSLKRGLVAVLTPEQVQYIMKNDAKSRLGLYPAEGESAWSRELKRFIEARSAGKRYEPLVGQGK